MSVAVPEQLLNCPPPVPKEPHAVTYVGVVGAAAVAAVASRRAKVGRSRAAVGMGWNGTARHILCSTGDLARSRAPHLGFEVRSRHGKRESVLAGIGLDRLAVAQRLYQHGDDVPRREPEARERE